MASKLHDLHRVVRTFSRASYSQKDSSSVRTIRCKKCGRGCLVRLQHDTTLCYGCDVEKRLLRFGLHKAASEDITTNAIGLSKRQVRGLIKILNKNPNIPYLYEKEKHVRGEVHRGSTRRDRTQGGPGQPTRLDHPEV